MPMNPVLSIRQAAQISGANQVYIQRLVHQGVIKSWRKAGRRFIDRKSFESWLERYRNRKDADAALGPQPVAAESAQ